MALICMMWQTKYIDAFCVHGRNKSNPFLITGGKKIIFLC